MTYEEPKSTWDKRYKQRHYGYRDSHSVASSVLTAAQALALAQTLSPTVYYVFGINARLITAFNWPQSTDVVAGQPLGVSCYAREIMFYCTQNAWVRLVSLNPLYVKFLTLGYTAARIQALGIPMLLTETETYLPANSFVTLRPTLGYAVVFRADTVAGTLYITAEGNMEGTD